MASRIKYDKVPQGALSKAPDAQVAKRSLTEVGRISIGEKDPQRGFPKSTDYFVIRSRFAQMVLNLYGEKPTELPVFFYSDDFNEVCNERLEIRDSAGRLFGYGDGETFHIYNPQTGQYVAKTIQERPDIMEATAGFLKPAEWVATLTIRLAIKDIPALGYWQFTTKGVKTSIPNLRDRFDECLATFGTVRFFPFSLTVKKVKSDKPGDKRQYPVVDLIPQFSIETGLKISQYLSENPDFNQARLALMNPNDLANGAMPASRLLKGGSSIESE